MHDVDYWHTSYAQESYEESHHYCRLWARPCSPILEDIDISEAAKALWEAPFAVLSHDKFESKDPVFTYANKV